MIRFDNSSTGVAVSATSLTYSHTCAGVKRLLFVSVWLGSTVDSITAVTYNGVPMTRITDVTQNTSGNFLALYMLVNPSGGANNIVITTSVGVNIRSVGESLTGGKQTTQVDNSTTGTQDSATSITHSITTNTSGCWVIAATQNDINVCSSGNNYTNRNNSAGGGIGDTNAGVSVGSISQTVNLGSSANWCIIQASIAPFLSGMIGSDI